MKTTRPLWVLAMGGCMFDFLLSLYLGNLLGATGWISALVLVVVVMILIESDEKK